MNKKLVIFGPWIGEFTYEISWWIPEIRELRNTKYKDFKSIAVSSKGRKMLYSDFIDEFIYYPNNLESQRKYPSTKGEHVHYVGDIIPDNFNKFISELKQKYGNKYQVTCYSPNEFDSGSGRTLNNNPFGKFIHYKASDEVIDEIKKEIRFDNDSDTVALSARLKDREKKVDGENWNPNSWSKFIERIIVELDLNVVFTTIKNEKNKGGTFDFSNFSFYKKYKTK